MRHRCTPRTTRQYCKHCCGGRLVAPTCKVCGGLGLLLADGGSVLALRPCAPTQTETPAAESTDAR
jgi:hypothetical protein